ncbi:MAG: hypothetical protein H0T42_33250 [Deltaproteobacteria bacterium]|nr:hypothetical protein [Deltaproteobacteria bacterium]
MRLPAAVVLALAVSAAVAEADTTTPTAVAQLMVLEPGDASYKLFHGAVWLDVDKAATNYRWGGLQCKGRELSDTSIQLLFAAFRAEYQVAVEYVVTEYKGKQFRCVTGFTISKS